MRKSCEKYMNNKKSAIFLDPPYTAGKKRAGKRLYNHSEVDHQKLFEMASELSGSFLMTYDNDENIKAMAEHFSLDYCEVAMRNTHLAKMTELIIGKGIGWAR